MIAVLLAPTASIARHDDHRTDANPVRWFNGCVLSPASISKSAMGSRCHALRFSSCYCILLGTTYRGQGACDLWRSIRSDRKCALLARSGRSGMFVHPPAYGGARASSAATGRITGLHDKRNVTDDEARAQALPRRHNSGVVHCFTSDRRPAQDANAAFDKKDYATALRLYRSARRPKQRRRPAACLGRCTYSATARHGTTLRRRSGFAAPRTKATSRHWSLSRSHIARAVAVCSGTSLRRQSCLAGLRSKATAPPSHVLGRIYQHGQGVPQKSLFAHTCGSAWRPQGATQSEADKRRKGSQSFS